jgi:hypothetical protein
VKLDPIDVEGTQEKYLVKGYTQGYSTDKVMDAFNMDFPVSK